MLSETDIHYLVGLLTKVQSADDVVVELGDLVHDASTDTKRDVDITVSNRDGSKSVYRGTEVKNHSRPLDTGQVEGLCLKFMDMPDITHRAIVSASGYTKPAVAKAKAHSVELLEIVDWPDPRQGFNVRFDTPALTMVEPVWRDGPHVKVNVAQQDYAVLQTNFAKELPIVDESGNPYPSQTKTLGDLMMFAHQKAGHDAQESASPMTVTADDLRQVEATVGFNDTPHVKLGDRLVPVENMHVAGSIGFIVHDKPIFKILRVLGSKKPLTGCVMVELANKSLIGVSVSNLNNKITALNIPYSDRVKKKIRGHRIG